MLSISNDVTYHAFILDTERRCSHGAGCLAPHSKLRNGIIPTPSQQGIVGEEVKTLTPYWKWAQLLGRVFDLDMAICPFCRCGSLRLIGAITQEEVITRILRHLNLASVPPPIAPARLFAKRSSLSMKPTPVWAHRRGARCGGVYRPFAL